MAYHSTNCDQSSSAELALSSDLEDQAAHLVQLRHCRIQLGYAGPLFTFVITLATALLIVKTFSLL